MHRSEELGATGAGGTGPAGVGIARADAERLHAEPFRAKLGAARAEAKAEALNATRSYGATPRRPRRRESVTTRRFMRGSLEGAVEAAEQWLEAHYGFVEAASQSFARELDGDLGPLVYATPDFRLTAELRDFVERMEARQIPLGDVFHARLADFGGPLFARAIFRYISWIPCQPGNSAPTGFFELDSALRAALGHQHQSAYHP